MNVLDIIVYLAFAWAIFSGWRKGFLLQMLSLLAVVASLYMATQYGAEAGALLGIDGVAANVTGFIVIFLAGMLLIAIGGHMARAIFRFAGLGVADTILGILFSVVKMTLIVSIIFAWVATMNRDYSWIPKPTIEESRWFEPLSKVPKKLTPYFEDLKDNLLNL